MLGYMLPRPLCGLNELLSQVVNVTDTACIEKACLILKNELLQAMADLYKVILLDGIITQKNEQYIVVAMANNEKLVLLIVKILMACICILIL